MGNIPIGVTVREDNSRISRPATGAATSVAGFFLHTKDAEEAETEGEHRIATAYPVAATAEVLSWSQALMGLLDEETQTAMAEDRKTWRLSPGLSALKGFFDNGGQRAFVCAKGKGDSEAAIAEILHEDIQLLLCPEDDGDEVHNLALNACEKHGRCFYVGQAQDREPTELTSVYGALYSPRLKDGVPIVGHVAGVFARTAATRGVWKAPAGPQAQLRGALELTEHVGDDDFQKAVENKINVVRRRPGAGLVIGSARTLRATDDDTAWRYVSTRLLMNYIKSSLMDGIAWAHYEPNDARLWGRLEFNTIRPFLMDLWRRGAFGSGTPDECFQIRIDAELNPPAAVNNGELAIEVTFYPVRPAESIVLTIGQQDSGATARER